MGPFSFKRKKFTSKTTLCLTSHVKNNNKKKLKKGPIGVGCGGCLGYGGKWQQLPWLLWPGHLIVVTQTMFTFHVR
jgi:hypothetical protein